MKTITEPTMKRDYYGRCPSCGAEYEAWRGELERLLQQGDEPVLYQRCAFCNGIVVFKEKE